MKLFAVAALLAFTVSADEYTVERDSRTDTITNLASPTLYVGTTDEARYENFIKWSVVTDAADSTDTAGYLWDMWVKSVYKNDDGEVYLRIMHEITHPVKPDDILEIELQFESASDPFVDRAAMLSYDAVTCNMIQNSQDTQFWTQDTTDGYYLCDDVICSNQGAARTTDDVENWTIPVVDDEELTPFCTPHATDTTTYSCSSIICMHERPMVTGDTQDYQFAVSSTGTPASPTYTDDKMIL